MAASQRIKLLTQYGLLYFTILSIRKIFKRVIYLFIGVEDTFIVDLLLAMPPAFEAVFEIFLPSICTVSHHYYLERLCSLLPCDSVT